MLFSEIFHGRILFTLAIAPLVFAYMAHADDKNKDKPAFVCPPCNCDSDSKTFEAPGKCPSCGMGLVKKMPQRTARNVALVVFEGFEVLDFAGPAEVFAATLGSNGHEFQVYTVATTAEDVESNNAIMTVKPEYTLEKAPKPDIVVLPGGNISSVTRDEKMMEWIKARAKDSEIVMSVCNGAVALHRAGLLEGLEITSHRSALEYYFKREAPTQKIAEGKRFVDNGKIITAAGVSAGIDAALHVVDRLLGPEAADNTAEYMEYVRTGETKSASR